MRGAGSGLRGAGYAVRVADCESRVADEPECVTQDLKFKRTVHLKNEQSFSYVNFFFTPF